MHEVAILIAGQCDFGNCKTYPPIVRGWKKHSTLAISNPDGARWAHTNHKCSMTGNRRVSNVRTPYLIRTLYLAFAQKMREFLMFRMRFRGIETRTPDRPSADSSISATCAPVYDSLCARGVSVQQSNEELRKRASPYKSPSFRP